MRYRKVFFSVWHIHVPVIDSEKILCTWINLAQSFKTRVFALDMLCNYILLKLLIFAGNQLNDSEYEWKSKWQRFKSILIVACSGLLIIQILENSSMLDTSTYTHNKAFDPVFLRLKCELHIQWLGYKNIHSWQQTFVAPVESNGAGTAISLEHRQNLAHRYNMILSLGDETWEGLSWQRRLSC